MAVKPSGDGKYWILTEELVYEHPETGDVIRVPRGFVTDFASVPRLFWTAFPPCEKYTPAAVVHDYLYWEQPAECDRLCADKTLELAMKESNVDPLTTQAIYQAVHLGGGTAWDENKKAKAAGAIRMVPEPFMSFEATMTWAELEARIRAQRVP